ncbi:hypothetical protein HRI_004393300 [Hibiscus trionum]|uniref:Nucleoside diphosphate kinase-like domain-containing protein n=1 Tax=Hibiscus trionum TaxID=183268 RepID=A0A9W7MS39_HIBTR|nr:hypothetical protein HRI_004393300 [Hibiscus trionum]
MAFPTGNLDIACSNMGATLGTVSIDEWVVLVVEVRPSLLSGNGKGSLYNMLPRLLSLHVSNKRDPKSVGIIHGSDSYNSPIDIGRNVIHGSDSVESARKEIALWLPESPVNWHSSVHPWI